MPLPHWPMRSTSAPSPARRHLTPGDGAGLVPMIAGGSDLRRCAAATAHTGSGTTTDTVLARKPRCLAAVSLAALIAGAALLAFGAREVRPGPVPGAVPHGACRLPRSGNLWLWQGGARRLTGRGPRMRAPSPSRRWSAHRLPCARRQLLRTGHRPTTGGEPQSLTNDRPSAGTGSPSRSAGPADGGMEPRLVPRMAGAWPSCPTGELVPPVLWLMGQGGDNPHSLTTTPPNPVLERPTGPPAATRRRAASAAARTRFQSPISLAGCGTKWHGAAGRIV